MRDFRDAKAMAQTLRASLTAKTVTVSHSESLELVSKMFGVADWNTLSAQIQAGREGPPRRRDAIPQYRSGISCRSPAGSCRFTPTAPKPFRRLGGPFKARGRL